MPEHVQQSLLDDPKRPEPNLLGKRVANGRVELLQPRVHLDDDVQGVLEAARQLAHRGA